MTRPRAAGDAPAGSVLPDGASLRPEQRLLLCCARVRLEASHRELLLRLVRGPVDWDRLLAAAALHGVTPLLSRHLHEAGAGEVPPGVLGLLREESHRHLVHSFALLAELVALLEAFRATGVTAVPFKGPVAALAFYGDLGLRTFGDLDLLVPEAEVPRAWRILEARGFRPQFPLGPDWQALHVRTGCEHLFRHPGSGRLVDLHWSLMPRGYGFTPPADGLWADREPVRLGPTEVFTLGTEATLLFLCLHGLKHDWACLEWLCDLAELVRARPALDWDRVLGWSAAPGRRRPVDLGLHLAARLLEAPVPAEALRRAASDPEVATLAAEAASRLLALGAPAEPSAWRRTFGSLHFRAMTGRDRLRFVRETLFQPTPLEWALVPLPPALAALHYGVRPARLAAKHARALVSRARGGRAQLPPPGARA